MSIGRKPGGRLASTLDKEGTNDSNVNGLPDDADDEAIAGNEDTASSAYAAKRRK